MENLYKQKETNAHALCTLTNACTGTTIRDTIKFGYFGTYTSGMARAN